MLRRQFLAWCASVVVLAGRWQRVSEEELNMDAEPAPLPIARAEIVNSELVAIPTGLHG